MISTESLSKKYGENFVLKDVSTSLPTNKIIAFIGCNGAGKSTMLNLISRLIPPSEGCAFVDSKRISDWDTRELAKRLTMLGQSLNAEARITVGELVSFGRFPHSGGRMTEQDELAVSQALRGKIRDAGASIPLRGPRRSEAGDRRRAVRVCAKAAAPINGTKFF